MAGPSKVIRGHVDAGEGMLCCWALHFGLRMHTALCTPRKPNSMQDPHRPRSSGGRGAGLALYSSVSCLCGLSRTGEHTQEGQWEAALSTCPHDGMRAEFSHQGIPTAPSGQGRVGRLLGLGVGPSSWGLRSPCPRWGNGGEGRGGAPSLPPAQQNPGPFQEPNTAPSLLEDSGPGPPEAPPPCVQATPSLPSGSLSAPRGPPVTSPSFDSLGSYLSFTISSLLA